MRQFLTALGLSLFLHGLLLSMIPGWVKNKSEIRMRPQFVTLVLSHDQNQLILPIQKRKPEKIQNISVPGKNNEKKKQIKQNPDIEIKRSFQTSITSDRLNKLESPVRLTEFHKAEPEIKDQKKVKPASIRPVIYKTPPENINATHKIFPDINVPDDNEYNLETALPENKSNVLSQHDQGMQIIMPYYKRNPAPPYPEIARQRGYQGIVVLDMLINQEGNVDKTLLFQSSGHIILDRTAIASVKNWFFEPGKKGDQAMKMWVKVPIRFQLK